MVHVLGHHECHQRIAVQQISARVRSASGHILSGDPPSDPYRRQTSFGVHLDGGVVVVSQGGTHQALHRPAQGLVPVTASSAVTGPHVCRPAAGVREAPTAG